MLHIGCHLSTSNDTESIMGYPDDLKFRSSMMLFHLANPGCEVFQNALDKYFDGIPDNKTIPYV